MKKTIKILTLLLTFAVCVIWSTGQSETPSPRQMADEEMELYGFCLFTINTYTGREWGTGGESETVFNSTAFNANQIVSTMNAGGLKGVILTCEHKDDFCLWPGSSPGTVI
jgi:alpha-L-fucosidase